LATDRKTSLSLYFSLRPPCSEHTSGILVEPGGYRKHAGFTRHPGLPELRPLATCSFKTRCLSENSIDQGIGPAKAFSGLFHHARKENLRTDRSGTMLVLYLLKRPAARFGLPVLSVSYCRAMARFRRSSALMNWS
jgi:hypothetical protein